MLEIQNNKYGFTKAFIGGKIVKYLDKRATSWWTNRIIKHSCQKSYICSGKWWI